MLCFIWACTRLLLDDGLMTVHLVIIYVMVLMLCFSLVRVV
jgi:hypothetical protein